MNQEDRPTIPPDLVDPIEAIILRSMNEGVLTLECNGHIHTVNPAALSILGIEGEDPRGRKFQDFIDSHPGNEHFKRIILDVIDRGIPTFRTETEFVRKDNQKVDLSVATSFLQVHECAPALENVVVVLSDISSLKAIERARRRAVDHLSHELKTPLAIIEASLARMVAGEKLDPSHRKGLNRIRRNLKRLLDIQELVEQITNPPTLSPQECSVDEVVRHALSQIEPQMPHRSVKLEAPAKSGVTYMVDPELVTIVTHTLVKNAVENTPDGGVVRILLEPTESGLALKVRDTGVGIRLRDNEFLFDGFHHTQETDDYSTKKPFDFNAGGKGMELMRLKALAEEGVLAISFESERCRYIPAAHDECPGRISDCPHVSDLEGCMDSGGTEFTVVFRRPALHPSIRS